MLFWSIVAGVLNGILIWVNKRLKELEREHYAQFGYAG
jgi:hypothetical protein